MEKQWKNSGNYKLQKRSYNMKLPDNVYTILKWVLGVAVAPTIALITGLGELYHFDTTYIIGTISLIATFLSAIFGISMATYKDE